ncbi:Aldehyde:ferredoxin oxidoreductase [Desulfosarcina cetonica]|uniref:aldehyde ferredoxin oxidoreductase N-terminal domain-containing protein n=1 Tax=Desulfosarcina cetonica TaxID=90730 RepID=UPI0006D27C13|nr:aldehyde ferredoxin oxidoreductase N-terminal domain-containing protein [Desulfosarcina cetonica]VTR66001.1 Aldehyde:ferredoxin oxidoreductase [Desulfosarcina cetonica]
MEYLSADKIAVIDLASRKVMEDELDEDLVTERIGGIGITKHLYEKYADEDPIVIGTGLLTGSLFPGSSLGILTARSPRTNNVCHAPFCQHAGMEFKYAGFDYIVIKGVSETPVYLWLHDGIADIKPADEIYDMTPWEIVDNKKGLRGKLGDELIQFLSVGKAAEVDTNAAQVLVNCWSSGDRWGFGRLFGEKKLKTIAMRGMGLMEVADPEDFLDKCTDLVSLLTQNPALAKKGCIAFPAAMGAENIVDWIAPLVHRHSAAFNTPFPYNTFVKYNEAPTVMKESDVEEPGVMITDIAALLGFKKLNLSAEQACRMIEACNKYGIDPTAAAAMLEKSGAGDFESMQKQVPGLKENTQDAGTTPFSPWCPSQPLFAAFDGATDAAWWQRRQAVAYIFGIDPIFAIMAPEITEAKLIEAVTTGTELEISADTLEDVIASVIS